MAEWPRGCLQSSSTPVQIGNLALGDSAAIAERFHPDPFRTRQLSSLTSDIVMRYASSRELFNAAPSPILSFCSSVFYLCLVVLSCFVFVSKHGLFFSSQGIPSDRFDRVCSERLIKKGRLQTSSMKCANRDPKNSGLRCIHCTCRTWCSSDPRSL